MVILAKNGIQIERLTLGPYQTNAYILVCTETKESLLVDAPAEANKILESLKGTKPNYILITHNHRDHVGALTEVRSSLKIPMAAHTLNTWNLEEPPEKLLYDGDTVFCGNHQVEVLHTPGHTRGSLCFKVGKYLIAGDTIFPGGPGKTESPDAFKQIVKSITEKIFVLPDDTLIYPGHGDSTLLKDEKEEFRVFSSRPHRPDLFGDVLWLSS
ncbi:MAG: MBL fold metallo-hydrolase [Chloroflexota bacterium]